MSLYIDTSCLLKLLFQEPERSRVYELVINEPKVIVSDLTRLEALIQINAHEQGRGVTPAGARSMRKALASILAREPFVATDCPAYIIRLADRQVALRAARVHCRTLDRLHLAAMEGLGLRQLLTNDIAQAGAARALGFAVLMPT